ncbi:hypothetical protein [Ruegeria atlantica]|uniref:hypothetical protein n=1 Tax=Ruegeria atlantica TaxID=81569 RepID=UPI00147D39B3|nr:hypothetical protein [Ruegeria atlantica]
MLLAAVTPLSGCFYPLPITSSYDADSKQSYPFEHREGLEHRVVYTPLTSNKLEAVNSALAVCGMPPVERSGLNQAQADLKMDFSGALNVDSTFECPEPGKD